MFYLGCDQHARQITICLRDEKGDVVLKRQVSTRPAKIGRFLDEVGELTEGDGGYLAMVEVCGFNEWFLDMLHEKGCRERVLIQPQLKSTRKTDRRDAAELSELLWVNRERLREGKRVNGLRRVTLPGPEDRQLRKLTTRRSKTKRRRGKVVTQIKTVLRNHNLQHDCPTKKLDTKKGFAWLRELELPAEDRLEVDQLLDEWELLSQQLEAQDALLEEHGRREEKGVSILTTIPGCALFSALVLLSRIGELSRFANPRSLANYFGLTPKCNNTGDAKQRLGSISKEGSALVRFVLGLMVTSVIRKDPWMRKFYRRIKVRRGAKIARVAVMRRLCTVIYHMLKHEEPYVVGGPDEVTRQRTLRQCLREEASPRVASFEASESSG
jgi:transposase